MIYSKDILNQDDRFKDINLDDPFQNYTIDDSRHDRDDIELN